MLILCRRQLSRHIVESMFVENNRIGQDDTICRKREF